MSDLLYYLTDIETILILLETYLISFVAAGCWSLALYVVHAFARMKMGQKAGLGKEWQAWVPFAQEIYLVKLAKVPKWKVIFFGSYMGLTISVVYGLALVGILLDAENIYFGTIGFGSIAALVLCIALIVYAIWALVENVKTYLRLYKNFSNTGSVFSVAAIIGIFINSLGIIIADCFIAFNKKYTYIANGSREISSTDKKATITGTTGYYKGQSFDINDGETVVFGRDPEFCNIIFGSTETAVSRKHCSVKYIGASDSFLVTVYSKNGVYYDGNSVIEAGSSRILRKGSIISLGTATNQFILG